MSTQGPKTTINKNVLIQKVSEYWEEDLPFTALLATLTEFEMSREVAAQQHDKGQDATDSPRSGRQAG